MDLNWNRLLAIPFALALVACAAEDDDKTTDTDTDATDTDTTTCNSGIKSPTLPANGASDVYYRTTFAIDFVAAEATTATFALTKDSDSSTVALEAPTWSDDGKSVYFKSTAALESETAYTLAVDFSCSEGTPSEIKFTTSDVGAAVTNEEILGGTYGIDIGTATIIEPPGVNQLLGSLLGQLEETIAVNVKSIADDEIVFFGGLADAPGGVLNQDLCTETIVFPEAADFTGNPFFEIDQPDGLTLNVEGIEITLLELNLSGSFAPGGGSIVGIELAGAIDTRDLGDLLGDELGAGDGDDAVCSLISTFTSGAVACENCPGTSDPYCLSLVAADIVADLLTGDLVERSAQDILDDETCTPPAM